MADKIKVTKISITENDLLFKYLPAHYSDAFQCVFTSTKDIVPDDVQILFWTEMPGIAMKLMELRNKIVKHLGLKVGDIPIYEWLKSAERSNSATSAETVILCDDKHLSFYVSIKILMNGDNERSITVSTLVQYHNIMGRIYFLFISPFHSLLVRQNMKHIISKYLL